MLVSRQITSPSPGRSPDHLQKLRSRASSLVAHLRPNPATAAAPLAPSARMQGATRAPIQPSPAASSGQKQASLPSPTAGALPTRFAYNDRDVTSNDEDDDAEEYESQHEDDSRSVIGFSIGPLQRQLTWASATHAQKRKALETSANDGVDESDDAVENEHVENEASSDESDPSASTSPRVLSSSPPTFASSEPQSTSMPPTRLPSPRRERSDTTLRGGRAMGRPRAFTTIPKADGDQGFRKFLPTLPKVITIKPSMPSLPNLPKMGSALSWFSNSDSEQKSSNQPSHIDSSSSRDFAMQNNGASPTAIVDANLQARKRPPGLLRRTTSDGSLYLNRSLSRASSLGDDSRWENVHAQVNSRMKAIKDSLADSNLRLPRLPNISDIDIHLPRVLSKPFENERKDSNSAPPRPGARAFLAQDDPDLGSPIPGMSKSSAREHPYFTKAVKHLTGDLVILGGYRGSVLRAAEPPNRQVWVPVKVGLNLRKVNLEVGLQPEDETNMTDNIIPSGMLKNIGPVDISRRLFKRLQASINTQEGKLRVWDFGYDWRLSPHLLSRYLTEFLESLPCNQSSTPEHERGATVIAHSLGGLITRHAINQKPELVRGVLYAGVPQHCVNILGPLRNGDDVLLSSRVLTAQVNFTIRTSYALLPLSGKCFIDSDTRERYDVDFFDIKNWEEFRLSPCIARPYPLVEPTRNGIRGSMASVFSLPGKRGSSPGSNRRLSSPSRSSLFSKEKRITESEGGSRQHAMGPQMDHRDNPAEHGEDPETSVSTAVTIPKEDAMEYLARTLADVKRFKQELAYRPELAGRYPSVSCIYGKSIPTVYGARVKGREGIKCADAYDDLAFASGDGVVLAKAAQIPEGYKVSRGGVVSSDRGHISLLGDLEAVGICLLAMRSDQKRRFHNCTAKNGKIQK